MGWGPVAELGQAPGTERAPGKRALVQRQLCPEEAHLHNAAGLGALPAGTQAERDSRQPGGCEQRRARCRRNLHSSVQGKSLAAGQCRGGSWKGLLDPGHLCLVRSCQHVSRGLCGVEKKVLQGSCRDAQGCAAERGPCCVPKAVCWGRASAACQGLGRGRAGQGMPAKRRHFLQSLL